MIDATTTHRVWSQAAHRFMSVRREAQTGLITTIVEPLAPTAHADPSLSMV
jgi:hypothetical protein